MDWKDLGSKIANTAPLLGGILGGPVGGAVGTGVKLLASAFGLKPEEATPEKIDEIIKADPQALLKLKEIEANNRVELGRLNLEAKRIELESERINLEDRGNAREREVKIVEKTGKKDNYLYILASTVVIGFFILCVVLMRIPLPAGSSEVIFMLFGALSSGFGMVLQYFFGSSKSSTDKTALLAQSAQR